MKYPELLASPEWQKRRLQIFSRDNWTCQGCGNKSSQLEIHHTVYFKGFKPWDYPDDLLITCCHKCHGSEQVRFKHEIYLLNALQLTGFLASDLLAFSIKLQQDQSFVEEIKRHIRKLISEKPFHDNAF